MKSVANMLIVLVGNIGTGKSTYANEQKKLDSKTQVVSFDEINEEQHKIDNNFKIVSDKIESYLDSGMNVIVDGLNLDRSIRAMLVSFAKRKQKYSKIIDFGLGDESSLQRRIKKSPDTPAEEWRKRHNKNQLVYEKPSSDEYYDEICIKYSLE